MKCAEFSDQTIAGIMTAVNRGEFPDEATDLSMFGYKALLKLESLLPIPKKRSKSKKAQVVEELIDKIYERRFELFKEDIYSTNAEDSLERLEKIMKANFSRPDRFDKLADELISEIQYRWNFDEGNLVKKAYFCYLASLAYYAADEGYW